MSSHRAVPPLVATVGLFAVDRVAKWLCLHLLPGGGIFLIPDVTGIVLVRNRGIAYGVPLPPAVQVGLAAVIVVATVAVGTRAYRRGQQRLLWGAALLFGGAVANLLDRLRYGWVIDTFVVTGWPVFNVADLMILAGAVLITIHLVRRHA